MRAEPVLVAALLAVAGLAWWSVAGRMAGMDAAPGSALGSLGWFTGVWATMMAAMMLPSLAPTAAAFAASAGRVLLFVAGYLLVWNAAGVVAYGLFELGRGELAGSLAWDGGGHLLVAGALAFVALYQLTPLKRAFLSRCRNPPPATGGDRGTGRAALATGVRAGGWCLGCSGALMAAMFALGVMSLTWMASIAVLVALEKLGPWSRAARLTTALALVAMATMALVAPHEIPGLVAPGHMAMQS